MLSSGISRTTYSEKFFLSPAETFDLSLPGYLITAGLRSEWLN